MRISEPTHTDNKFDCFKVFEEKPDLDFKPEETPAMEKDAETRTLIKTAVKKNPKMDWIKDSEADYIARYATRRAISAGEAVITQVSVKIH